MIAYPYESAAHKRALFAALAEVAGGGRAFLFGPLSLRGFPETGVRVAEAMMRAKRPHRGVLRVLKRLLLRLTYNGARRYFAAHPGVTAVAWNGLGGARRAFLMGAQDAGAPVLSAELAPLPGKITLDPSGVNFESSLPRDPAFYRALPAPPLAAPVALKARESRRADVGQSAAALPGTPFLFCPLQVPGDSQVTLFAGWCGGMAGFLAALDEAARHLPPGWHLRLKEHPSARKSLRGVLESFQNPRLVIDNESDSFAQIAAARGVVTLNSSMGLQAFFYEKPVLVLGRAFWAVPGLAVRPNGQAALNAAFAAPESLSFDPSLRAAFLQYLTTEYYPDFTPAPLAYDAAAFAFKLAAAKTLSQSD